MHNASNKNARKCRLFCFLFDFFTPQTSTFLSPLHPALTSVLVLFVRPLLPFGTQYPAQSVHLPPSTPSNAANKHITSVSLLPRSSSPRACIRLIQTFCMLVYSLHLHSNNNRVNRNMFIDRPICGGTLASWPSRLASYKWEAMNLKPRQGRLSNKTLH